MPKISLNNLENYIEDYKIKENNKKKQTFKDSTKDELSRRNKNRKFNNNKS